MKTYCIQHREADGTLSRPEYAFAEDAQEACERFGWMVGNCFVKEEKEG